MADWIHIDGCSNYGQDIDISYAYNSFPPYDSVAYGPMYGTTYPRHPNKGYIRLYASDYIQKNLRKFDGQVYYNTITMGAAFHVEPRLLSSTFERFTLFQIYGKDPYPSEQFCVSCFNGRVGIHEKADYTDPIEVSTDQVIKNYHWHYVEFKAFLSPYETSGAAIVYVDGIQCIEEYGIRTLDSNWYSHGSAGISHIRLGSLPSQLYLGLTDLYIQGGMTNIYGAPPENEEDIDGIIIGPSRIDSLIAINDSTPLMFTPSGAPSNYECIGRSYWGDNPNIYVYGVLGDKDIYEFDNLEDIGISSVHAVSISVAGINEGATTTNITGCVDTAVHSTKQLLGDSVGTGYGIEQFLFVKNPKSGQNWTEVTVNNSNYGVLVVV
jgi:hypothetical protein